MSMDRRKSDRLARPSRSADFQSFRVARTARGSREFFGARRCAQHQPQRVGQPGALNPKTELKSHHAPGARPSGRFNVHLASGSNPHQTMPTVKRRERRAPTIRSRWQLFCTSVFGLKIANVLRLGRRPQPRSDFVAAAPRDAASPACAGAPARGPVWNWTVGRISGRARLGVRLAGFKPAIRPIANPRYLGRGFAPVGSSAAQRRTLG
jgi:hypothetical protein